jgi:anti-sigma regulatory factor (Ser/Thr protein kinase)
VISLEPTARSVGAARRFVSGLLDDYDVDVRDTVVLLVSELVSNAVEHGGPHGPTSTVGVEVDARADRVRVEVTDAGTGEPVVGNGSVHRPSGRGVLLVESIADRWGCNRLPVGKTVWFEVVLPSGGEVDG